MVDSHGVQDVAFVFFIHALLAGRAVSPYRLVGSNLHGRRWMPRRQRGLEPDRHGRAGRWRVRPMFRNDSCRAVPEPGHATSEPVQGVRCSAPARRLWRIPGVQRQGMRAPASRRRPGNG
jgi:hypothetical protein